MSDKQIWAAETRLEAAVTAGMNARLPENDCGCYTEEGVATCLMCLTSDFWARLEAAAPILTRTLLARVVALKADLATVTRERDALKVRYEGAPKVAFNYDLSGLSAITPPEEVR